jgi:hypothetical protein
VTEQRKNGYEDADFKKVLAELDEMDAEAASVMASAKGKVSAIRKRQKNRIKIADKELNIPPTILRTIRAQRKLEAKLQELADDVPEDLAEVYEDAAGQFSFFAPADGEEPAEGPAQAAARKRSADAAAYQEQEQKDGEAALKELAEAE